MPTRSRRSAKPKTEQPSPSGVWRPTMDSESEFNPFANTVSEGGLDRPGGMELLDATVDTAPLQGGKDLSDKDSLRDVLAAALAAPRRQRVRPRRKGPVARKAKGKAKGAVKAKAKAKAKGAAKTKTKAKAKGKKKKAVARAPQRRRQGKRAVRRVKRAARGR